MQVTNVCVVKTKRDKSRPTLSHHDAFYTEKTLHWMTPLDTILITVAILWYTFFQCVPMCCSSVAFIILIDLEEVINKKPNQRWLKGCKCVCWCHKASSLYRQGWFQWIISSERVAVFTQRSEYWLKILVTWCEGNHRQRHHLSQRAEQMIVVVMEGRDGLSVAPHQSGRMMGWGA